VEGCSFKLNSDRKVKKEESFYVFLPVDLINLCFECIENILTRDTSCNLGTKINKCKYAYLQNKGHIKGSTFFPGCGRPESKRSYIFIFC
jgi:hypothetical protein